MKEITHVYTSDQRIPTSTDLIIQCNSVEERTKIINRIQDALKIMYNFEQMKNKNSKDKDFYILWDMIEKMKSYNPNNK